MNVYCRTFCFFTYVLARNYIFFRVYCQNTTPYMNSGGVVYKVCYGSKAGILDRIGFNSGYAFFPLHFNIPSLLLFFMSICELCGKQDSLVSAAVEGVDLKVCSSCAKFGTVRRQGSVVPSHAHSHSISRRSE